MAQTLDNLLTLEVVSPTYFKNRPIPSNWLAPEEKYSVNAGVEYFVRYAVKERQHFQVKLSPPMPIQKPGGVALKEELVYYVPRGTVRIKNNKTVQTQRPILLEIPSNKSIFVKDISTINLASAVMAVEFLKGENIELAGEIACCEVHKLNLGNPQDVDRYFELHDLCCSYSTEETIESCLQWLTIEQTPLLIYTYFLNRATLILLKGFNENGLIFNDPLGQWFPTGHSMSGYSVNYKIPLIQRYCAPDGDIYCHKPSSRCD